MDVEQEVFIHSLTECGTGSARERTVLLIEYGELHPIMHWLPPPKTRPLDTPRPIFRLPAKKFLRLASGSQGVAKAWLSQLGRAQRLHEEACRAREEEGGEGLQPTTAKVTLTVTTCVTVDSSTDDVSADTSFAASDWDISFSRGGSNRSGVNGDAEGMVMQTTRHVTLLLGRDGLGLTLIGHAPVLICEVEDHGVAYLAGLRAGDQLRAVNGEGCVTMAHQEVVALIREAISH